MATNLWPNADLESGVSPWTDTGGYTDISQSSTKKWEQSYSLLVETNGYAYNGTMCSFDGIEESTQYTFSFYAEVDASSVDMHLIIEDQDTNQLAGYTFDNMTTGSFIRYEGMFYTGAGDTGIIVKILQWATTVDTNIYIDGVMLETGGTASAWVNYSNPSEELVIADASHVHAAESPTITQTSFVLVLDDATHVHTSAGAGDGLWDLGAYIWPIGGIVLEAEDPPTLTVFDADHAFTAQSPTITQTSFVLVLDDAAHIHTSEVPALIQANVLAIADVEHVHAAEAVVLADVAGPGLTVLTIANAAHVSAAEAVILSPAYSVVVANTAHVTVAQWPVLLIPGEFNLIVANVDHVFAADEPALVQDNTLVVNDSIHLFPVRPPNLTLSGPGFPVDDDESYFVTMYVKVRRKWNR